MPESTITSVPLLDLDAQYQTIKDEIRQAIDGVLDHQRFIMGPEVKELEARVADYCGTSHAVGCASGSDALLLSLMAVDIQPGDYVLTSPYTFFATAGAIARLGAVPVYLDIHPDTFNIDPAQIEAFMEGKHPLARRLGAKPEEVKAIIPVHLYGQMADMDPIMKLAKRYELKVVEDAAQAIGAGYKGRRAGSIGHTGCFSFFPSKNLGGYGDGGMITTNDDELAERLRVLRVHGSKPKYHHKVVGVNSRLDTLQAAVLKVKLQYLDEWSETRREKAQNYHRMFEEAGLTASYDQLDCSEACASMGDEGCGLQSMPDKLITPLEREGAPENDGRHIYHQYVIRTHRRDELQAALKEANIGNAIYYPVPLHEQECFASLGYTDADCPASHCASRQTLALPVFPELTDEQQQYIVDTVADFLKS